MARVTPSEVDTNFETDLTTAQLNAWIDMATVLVDDIADADSSISDNRLEQIELALTRHFASAEDPRVASESLAAVEKEYQVNVGEGLYQTVHGTQAAMLDPTGTLGETVKPGASIGVPDARNID